ncbi:MAG: hypothetical protein HC896_09740 [Bacteroidales bacterium]|nr:hypothetical protein [Bacteroidales bacterium]
MLGTTRDTVFIDKGARDGRLAAYIVKTVDGYGHMANSPVVTVETMVDKSAPRLISYRLVNGHETEIVFNEPVIIGVKNIGAEGVKIELVEPYFEQNSYLIKHSGAPRGERFKISLKGISDSSYVEQPDALNRYDHGRHPRCAAIWVYRTCWRKSAQC